MVRRRAWRVKHAAASNRTPGAVGGYTEADGVRRGVLSRLRAQMAGAARGWAVTRVLAAVLAARGLASD